MQILAATDFSTRSQRAVRRAGLLARELTCTLTLLHVVDDDQPRELVELERREAERLLSEQIATMAELSGVRARPVVLAADPFEGILQAAATSSADLIVMGSPRRQLLRDVFIGTTVERVIRLGVSSVLMVNTPADQRYQTVAVAVDVSEPTINALRTAETFRFVDEARCMLIHAFIALGKAQMMSVGVADDQIEQYIASQQARARDELLAFLADNGFHNGQWSVRVDEGKPFDVISRAVRELRADLLLIGTRGRSGISRVLLGSVTEEALRCLDIDVLAVPPSR